MSGDTKRIDDDDKDFKENISADHEDNIESSKYEKETNIGNEKESIEEKDDEKPPLVENYEKEISKETSIGNENESMEEKNDEKPPLVENLVFNINVDDGGTDNASDGEYLNLNNVDGNEIANNLEKNAKCENKNTNDLDDDYDNREPLPFDVTEDCKRFILSKECTYVNDRFFKTKFNTMDLIVDNRTGYFNGTNLCLPLKLNINDWIENDGYFIDFERHCREELKVPFIYHVIDQTDPILNGVFIHMAGLNIFLSWAWK